MMLIIYTFWRCCLHHQHHHYHHCLCAVGGYFVCDCNVTFYFNGCVVCFISPCFALFKYTVCARNTSQFL